MKESELEKKFRKAVQQAGGKALKFVSPGNTGVPDRLVVLPGGHVGFVELKQKGKKPRADQRLQINRLQVLGCVVMVLDDVDQIPGVIAKIRNQSSRMDVAEYVRERKEVKPDEI